MEAWQRWLQEEKARTGGCNLANSRDGWRGEMDRRRVSGGSQTRAEVNLAENTTRKGL